MGWKDWVWSSSSSASQSSTASTIPSSSSALSQTTSSPQQTPPSAPAPPRSSKPLSMEEQAEAEFRDLLRELDQPPASLSTLPASSPQPRHADPSRVPSALLGGAAPASDPDSIHPASLLPTEMSCRAAFDAAFYCQSLGGQFVNLYRYGGVRNCSEMWSNFWFCMRTNRGGHDDGERVERVRKHYWERMEKYRTGPSSEDVWEVRMAKVDSPFQGDFEGLEKSSAQD